VISKSLLITILADDCTYLSSMMQNDKWCKCIQACICAKGRYFEHSGVMQMFVYIFCDQKKIK